MTTPTALPFAYNGKKTNTANTEQLWYTPNCIHPTEATLF